MEAVIYSALFISIVSFALVSFLIGEKMAKDGYSYDDLVRDQIKANEKNKEKEKNDKKTA